METAGSMLSMLYYVMRTSAGGGGGGGGLRPLVCTPYTPQHTQSIYLYFVLFLYGYETQYVNILYPFLLSLGPVVNILAIFSNANILKKIRE